MEEWETGRKRARERGGKVEPGVGRLGQLPASLSGDTVNGQFPFEEQFCLDAAWTECSCPPNPRVEALNPSLLVFGGGAFGR